MAAQQPARLPVLINSSRQTPSDTTSTSSTLDDLGLSRAIFGCEGEDAQLTGMTRSPLRRLLGLTVGSSLRFEPQRVYSPIDSAQRIA